MTLADSSSQHPTYPNPTITEALCEVHLEEPEGAPKGWMGTIFKALEPDFPEMEPVSEAGIEVRMGEPGLQQRFLPPRQRIRYRHPDRPFVVQLSGGLFTLNVVGEYPGWDEFSSRLGDYWERVRNVLKPSRILRVGLRYINAIARSQERQSAGFWLQENRYMAAAALKSKHNFLSRAQMQVSDDDRLIVTLAEKAPSEDSRWGSIILDIDRITETPVDASAESLLQVAGRLHTDVWDVFSSAMGPRLKSRLKGEE